MLGSSTAGKRGARRYAWPRGTTLVIFILALLVFVLLAMQLPEDTAPRSSGQAAPPPAVPALAGPDGSLDSLS